MMQFGKIVTLQILRAYKWAISPMFPGACRYVPSCSEYAMEAVERYGALRGGWLAMRRLLRCHPLAGSGYDPVVRAAVGRCAGGQCLAGEYLEKTGAGAPRI
jgi:putative membrane protein insertion efficiency factor